MQAHYLKRLPITMSAWVMAIRPRTLSIPTMQVAVALALAYSTTGQFNTMAAFCCWMIGVFITIATNLFNDAIDYQKGGDSIHAKGFAKVIRLGLLTQSEILSAAGLCLGIVFAAGLPLMMTHHWIFWIIALSAFMSYSYTGGVLPICYLGLSELFILIFYGFVCIGTTFFTQTGFLSLPLLLAILQMGSLAIIPNALNNFRDIEEDTLVSKRTLAVRFGKTFCRWQIATLAALPFILNLGWLLFGNVNAALLPFLCLPAAILLLYSINKHEPGPIFNQFFRLSAFVHFIFGFLLTLSFFL